MFGFVFSFVLVVDSDKDEGVSLKESRGRKDGVERLGLVHRTLKVFLLSS